MMKERVACKQLVLLFLRSCLLSKIYSLILQANSFFMKYLYSLSIVFYSLLVKLASNFNKKAKLRNDGVKQTFKILSNYVSEKTIWVHCASLGEFEQGRPLIEKIKKKYPNFKIALSFYSPSGYEIRKDYDKADVVFYLPDDNKKNAKKIIKYLNPQLVLFIKYEFWYWYLSELKRCDISVYLVSGIFRKTQVFFKSYGKFYRKILLNFKTIFVQNKESAKLLKGINIVNAIVAGDTRFDRVCEISKNKQTLPIIESFTKNCKVLIAGSTWKKDEEIIFNFINNNEHNNVKFIIAPHEIKKENIERIRMLSTKKTVLFSEANERDVKNATILIIDNIGMLSSLYFYGDIAYVGGGFGTGIHNILEAAVFNLPIIFGPKHKKFDEAKELVKRKSAFSVKTNSEFEATTHKLIKDETYRTKCGIISGKYVKEGLGSADKILKNIKF